MAIEFQSRDYAQRNQPPNSLAATVRELATALSALMRSEIRLAKTEFVQNTKSLSKQLSSAAIGGGLLFFGVFAFLAFAIIGLGDLMGGSYAWSALIVTAILVIPGALMLSSAIKKMSNPVQLPEFQETIAEDQKVIRERVVDIKNVPRRARA